MLLSPSELLVYLRKSPALSKVPERIEVRLLSLVASGLLFFQLVETAMYMLVIQNSMVFRAASLTHSADLIGFLYLAFGLMLCPHMYTLAWRPDLLDCRLPRRLAAAAGVFGGIMWTLLGTMAEPLDVEYLGVVFWLRGFSDIFLGGVFAYSLNAQFARKTAEDIERNAEPPAC